MAYDLTDHGLPLVALKEQRLQLVVSLLGRSGPLSDEVVRKLAEVQNAIQALEAVIADMDDELAHLSFIHADVTSHPH